MSLMAFGIIVIEMIEHPVVSLRSLDPDLVREILLFGIAFPLIGGLMFNALAHQREKVADPTTVPVLNHGKKDISTPRVLIVENESLLGAGIERLLAGETGLNVGGVTPPNETALIDTIKHLQPDVIILDEASLLTTPVKVLIDLLDYPKLWVVTVSANDNRVQISNKQHRTYASDILRDGFLSCWQR